jgi:hypothetical protein
VDISEAPTEKKIQVYARGGAGFEQSHHNRSVQSTSSRAPSSSSKTIPTAESNYYYVSGGLKSASRKNTKGNSFYEAGGGH